MTVDDFWASEAKKEGKEIGEVIENFYDEMARECVEAEKSLKGNFSEVLQMLRDYYDIDPECSEFEPIEVLSVEMVKVNYSFKKDSISLIATVKCADGLNRLIQYHQTSYHGSYMEPPDFDSDCRVIRTLN